MKIFVVLAESDVEIRAATNFETAGGVIQAEQVEGHDEYIMTFKSACACRSHRVYGRDTEEVDDRIYVGKAVCFDCGAQIGRLIVTDVTMFGFTEDRRVLSGAYGKVY